MSLWLSEQSPYPLTPHTSLLPQYDLIIIGSGMSGCSVAYHTHVKYPLKSILVLEQRSMPCSGATGRNGGHLFPDPVSEFENECVEAVVEVIEGCGIECGIVKNGTVVLYKDVECYNVAVERFEGMSEKGRERCEIWDAVRVEEELPVRKGVFVGGHLQKNACCLSAAGFSAGILKDSGADVVCNSKVDRFDEHSVTVDGIDILGKQIVDCRGSDVTDDGTVPVRGQLISSVSMDRIFKYSICVNDSGDEYLIQRADGRIVFGGFRRFSGTAEQEVGMKDDTSLNDNISKALRNGIESYFDLKTPFLIEQEWTGIMAFRDDDFVASPNALFGFSGHGMSRIFTLARDHVVL